MSRRVCAAAWGLPSLICSTANSTLPWPAVPARFRRLDLPGERLLLRVVEVRLQPVERLRLLRLLLRPRQLLLRVVLLAQRPRLRRQVDSAVHK